METGAETAPDLELHLERKRAREKQQRQRRRAAAPQTPSVLSFFARSTDSSRALGAAGTPPDDQHATSSADNAIK